MSVDIGSCVRTVLLTMLSLLFRPVAYWAFAGISHRTQLHGFEFLIAVESNEDAKALTGRLVDALMLIRDVDPPRFWRVRRYLRRIVVGKLKTNVGGIHLPHLPGCILAREMVEGYSVSGLAAALVHEATHGKIDGFGVRAWGGRMRERREIACIDEEMAFVEKLEDQTFLPFIQRRRDEWASRLKDRGK